MPFISKHAPRFLLLALAVTFCGINSEILAVNTVKELIAFQGIPAQPERTEPDADKDGVPDSIDECRYEFGTAKAKGCPDADNDGVPDAIDRCKNQAGTAYWYGCPDTDDEAAPQMDDEAVPSAPAEGEDKMELPVTEIADGFSFVQGGTFIMGRPRTGESENEDELQHPVTLDDFYISPYEVTQKQWQEIMGNRPSMIAEGCDECPVVNVSWNDIQVFLRKLNKRNPGHGYRLPTDAEWEYAARGGNQSKNYLYAGGNEEDLNEIAWYLYNSKNSKPRPVGQGKANELGLFDMSGNVYEWCNDWWDLPEIDQPVKNPQGPAEGNYRVIRGGAWVSNPERCKVTHRYLSGPKDGSTYIGFRLARSF